MLRESISTTWLEAREGQSRTPKATIIRVEQFYPFNDGKSFKEVMKPFCQGQAGGLVPGGT